MTEQDKQEVTAIIDAAFARAIPQIVAQTVEQTVAQTVAQTVEQTVFNMQAMWRDLSAGFRAAEARSSAAIQDVALRLAALEEEGVVTLKRLRALLHRLRRVEGELNLKPT